MQLRIRQRIFSWTDSYDVYDESGTPRYEVKAEFFSLSHRIHIFDKQTGQELGSISQRILALLPTFDIQMDGKLLGTIRKRFSLLRENYDVDYHGWYVDGNFLGWDYRVMQGDLEIMSISKELASWSDTYTLTYRNPANEIPGLLLVLAIDAANCAHND